MKTSTPNHKAILFLFSVLFLFSAKTFAQEKFQLSDYVNPEYKWQKLELDFRLGGNNSYYKHDIDNGSGSQKSDLHFSGSFRGNYYRTRNTSSYQGFQNVNFSAGLSSSRLHNASLTDGNPINDQKYNNGSVSFYAETMNRFYNKRKMFLETDLDFGAGYRRTNSDNTADPEDLPYLYQSGFYGYDIDVSVPVLVGFGRIEEVQDARMAVYILDDLLGAGDLKRSATQEEILSFSKFITNTKNQRFFDDRLRKIAEITAIDSFLTANGLKAESDASYYTLIYDNWEYANGPVRNQGSRFSVGLVPSIFLSVEDSKSYMRDTINNAATIDSYVNKYISESDAWGLDFMTGYIWEKPVNLIWQHTVEAGLAYALYNGNSNQKYYSHDTLTLENKNSIENPNAKLSLGYKIGYYPNSRTEIRLGVSTAYRQYWGNDVSNDGPEYDTGHFLLDNLIGISCHYYISPQLRFNFWLSSMYTYSKDNKELPDDETGDEFIHNLDNYINASLTYKIF